MLVGVQVQIRLKNTLYSGTRIVDMASGNRSIIKTSNIYIEQLNHGRK
jgi:hypothetical protein